MTTRGYEANKRWRANNPERRHAWKVNYNASTGSGTAPNLVDPWTDDQDELVLGHAVSDRRLALLLGRSVSAIQNRRHRLMRRGDGDVRWWE